MNEPITTAQGIVLLTVLAFVLGLITVVVGWWKKEVSFVTGLFRLFFIPAFFFVCLSVFVGIIDGLIQVLTESAH